MSDRTLKLFLIISIGMICFLTSCSGPCEKQVKVMSFNILNGALEDWPKVAEIIKTSNADIIGLSEAADSETFHKIAETLNYQGVLINDFKPNPDYLEWGIGNGIISKYPIVKTFYHWPEYYCTGLIGAEIAVAEDKHIMVFSTHLVYTPTGEDYCACEQNRIAELNMALDYIKQLNVKDMPIILMGDFNTKSRFDGKNDCPQTVLETAAKAGFKDAYRKIYPDPTKHPGNTHHAQDPNAAQTRIDYITFKGEIKPTKATVLDGENSTTPWPSDHRAVLIEMRF